MTDTPTIEQALAAVMSEVGAVAKRDQNKQQNYAFRGVDAVVNAVGPALRKHGVVMVPHAGIPVETHYASKSGAAMTRVVLPVTFAFHGPDGGTLDCHVYGESSDSGDKAMSKAHSVAWRVAMLQVFAIPTDDPDPDESAHERAAPPSVDWAAIGWDDRDAYEAALAQNRQRTRTIPSAEQDRLKTWMRDEGWQQPYTRAQLDEWGDMIDVMAGVPEPDDGRPFE